MSHSRYNLIHALVVTAVLFAIVFAKGISGFWDQFLHGIGTNHPPEFYLIMMGSSALAFGLLLLFLWISTLFQKALDPHDTPPAPAIDRARAVRFTLKVAPALILVAFLLCAGGSALISFLTGIKPADQDLVRVLADGSTSLAIRICLSLAILIQAPLIEEALFRGVLFRGFAHTLPLGVALGLSGFIFALAHINAGSFLALWYLGIAFAWLYHRTGTILAPMTAHFLFNATNLVLVTLFPGLI